MSGQHHGQAERERCPCLGFLALLGILITTTVASPPSALAQEPSCTADQTLLPGSILRRHSETPPAETEVVRVPIAEPGVLVTIDLTGGAGVRGVLHDADGQGLETRGAGRLVRTLGPGRFYVLVAGADGWAGEYGLRLETAP